MDIHEIVKLACKEFFWMHQHPELSEKEFQTTKRVKDFLKHYGIPLIDLPLKTGVAACIGTSRKKPIIALRCDMDALPIQEKTGLPYQSKFPGIMHACGHDFHTATMLGVALLLNEQKETLPGLAQIIFQPAEENGTGAKTILNTGILDHTNVIFGLHCSAMYAKGTIITREGAMHGASDTFSVIFHGRGSHACRPFLSIDPILMVTQYVNAVQAIVSHQVNPFDAAVISITHIESGAASNVIPDSGIVEGTVRTVESEDRIHICERLKILAENIAHSIGGTAEWTWKGGTPATRNDAEWVQVAIETAKNLHLSVEKAPNSLAGEDFAFYQEKIPGAFIQIGTGISPMNHNPEFRIDPDTLYDSISYSADLFKEACKKIQQNEEYQSD